MPVVVDPGAAVAALNPLLPESSGPIRYVDFEYGDNHNDGLTALTPWRTVDLWDVGAGDPMNPFDGKEENATPEPGWIFYCRGTETVRSFDFQGVAGTAENPVTIMAWPGEAVPRLDVVDATADLRILGLGLPLVARGDAYVKIVGFEFAGPADNDPYVQIAGTGVELLDCLFEQTGIEQVFLYPGADLVTIARCRFRSVLNSKPIRIRPLSFGSGVTGPSIIVDRVSIYDNLFVCDTETDAFVIGESGRRVFVGFNTFRGPVADAGGAVYLEASASSTTPNYPHEWRIAYNIFAELGSPAIRTVKLTPSSADWQNVSHDNLYWQVGTPTRALAGGNTLVDEDDNIAANPAFAGVSDSHLTEGSPAGRIVAAGPLVPTFDLDLTDRVDPTAVGAYEVEGAGTEVRTPKPRLGCGRYQAMILLRGGKRVVGIVPWTALSWERVWNDTSQAELELVGVSGHGAACCGVFADARPWSHELHVYRDSRRVWSGPIVEKRVRGDSARLLARDLTAWLWHRRIHQTHDFSGSQTSDPTGAFPDLSVMFNIYCEDAMSVDNSPGLCIEALATGIYAERNVLARQHMICGRIVEEFTEAGLNWTMVDREFYGGARIEALPAIPTLVDDSFMEYPEIVESGLKQENDAGVRGAGVGANGDALWAAHRDGDSAAEFGVLENSVSLPDATSIAAVRSASAARLALLKEPVGTIEEGRLDAASAATIEKLVPGALVPVRLNRSCIPVSQTYRLGRLRVAVTASDAGADEAVLVSFQPVGKVPGEEGTGTTTPPDSGDGTAPDA